MNSNEPLVGLSVPASCVVFINSALMKEATSRFAAADLRGGMAYRDLVRDIANQALEQWERFEAAGCGDEESRFITERAAGRR